MADLGFSQAAQSVILTDEDNQIEIVSLIEALSDSNNALLVRSLMVGRDSGGAHRNILVDSSGNVGIFATSLPLPTGAATSALQTTGNNSLASIDGKISLNYGVATAAIRVAAQIGNATAVADFNAGNSSAQTLRVVIASNQVVIPVGGNVASGATDSGSPVKIGAIHLTTQPTVTNNQRVNLHATNRGALIVSTGVDGFGLPTGASTSALQTTGNASLASIDGKIVQDFGLSSPAIRVAALIGNTSGSASFNAGTTDAQTIRVVLPTDQTSIPVTQSGTWTTGRTWSLSSGTDSISVIQSTSPWVISASSLPLPTGAATESTLASINAKINLDFGVSSGAIRIAALLGNASGVAAFNAGTTTSQTLRVVLPTDQTAIPVAQSGTWNINNISGTISLPTGAATAALQTTGNTSLSSIDTKLVQLALNYGIATGALRVASQIGNASGAADFNYGAVGAQTLRVASQIGNTTGAAAFGSGITNAQTLRVVLPTDQSAIPISDFINSGINGAITVTTTAIEAKVGASRLSLRKSLTVYNDGSQTVFWGYSSSVTAANGTPIFKGQFGEWDGNNSGVWLITSSGSSNCRITEAS